MIAVIFELEPRESESARYFELAGALRPALEKIDGFVSVERFESVTRPGHFLSLSIWRDEEAVRRWRCHAMHRNAQREGRDAREARLVRGARHGGARHGGTQGSAARESAGASSRSSRP
jgi:heme-degrading monooxygenase HmoA